MVKKSQATWGGRFTKNPADLMLKFSESVSFDYRLAPYDIAVSRAHSSMLMHVGLISQRELRAIHKGLKTLEARITDGKFKWRTALEDVHMNIEHALTKIAPEAAKLHTARSRNDQVATDSRLFLKKACQQLIDLLNHLQRAILTLAEGNQNISIPGYTHLQRAQPISVTHHLLAYVEMFSRDINRLERVAEDANWCPLGSGALAGTTLPIDREFVARELGFVDKRGRARITTNSMDAVADRDLFLDFCHTCAVCSLHISRIAEDIILWNSSEFGYVDLPDAFCTGSSLMPQKKNPDSLELLRGKSGRIVGSTQSLYTMMKGLPLTYNRDLQEDKVQVFDAFDQLCVCLQVLEATVSRIVFKKTICDDAVSDPVLLATDLVDWLVSEGVAFRNAHHIVGALVAKAEELKVPLDAVPDQVSKCIHPKLKGSWREVFDLQRAFKIREGVGMPGPKQIRKQLNRWKRRYAD